MVRNTLANKSDARTDDQREGKGLLEYQAHDGVLCTFRNRYARDWGKWCGP